MSKRNQLQYIKIKNLSGWVIQFLSLGYRSFSNYFLSDFYINFIFYQNNGVLLFYFYSWDIGDQNTE